MYTQTLHSDNYIHNICLNSGTVKLDVNILPRTGDFQVSENGSLVFSGRISLPNTDQVLQIPSCTTQSGSTSLRLKTADIYKELRLRGYDYGATFQGILDANNEGLY